MACISVRISERNPAKSEGVRGGPGDLKSGRA